MNKGIDYGLGQTNMDEVTGIRFGVISQYAILQAWTDSSEPYWGEPHCPKCGNKAENIDDRKDDEEGWEEAKYEFVEYMCRGCKYVFGGYSAYGDEPIGFFLDDGEYLATDCLDNDVMVFRSPYYTRSQFCSPCVPGAGNLDCPCNEGEKTFCFGHDWFEDGVAPYPVYDVTTGKVVSPEKC
jgi:hypothetical protein